LTWEYKRAGRQDDHTASVVKRGGGRGYAGGNTEKKSER